MTKFNPKKLGEYYDDALKVMPCFHGDLICHAAVVCEYECDAITCNWFTTFRVINFSFFTHIYLRWSVLILKKQLKYSKTHKLISEIKKLPWMRHKPKKREELCNYWNWRQNIRRTLWSIRILSNFQQ
jgi:hypothetical protein